MDPDVFPNSLEYWGPTGMVFFRNVQLRWMPIKGDQQPDARPRASGRQRRPGHLRGPHRAAEHQGALPAARLLRLPTSTRRSGATSAPPACSAAIKWDDVLDDQFDLSGDATGWGLNLSSNLNFGKNDVLRLPVRVRRRHPELHERFAGGHRHRQRPLEPRDAHPRRADSDHRTSCSSSITRGARSSAARSAIRARTTTTPTAQAPDAFRIGQYALGNLLYYPVPNVMMGGELQWGRRENFSDGFQSDGFKVQFSFKYNFSWKLGG